MELVTWEPLKFGRIPNDGSQVTVWSDSAMHFICFCDTKIIKQLKKIESIEEYIILMKRYLAASIKI